ncbi:DNA gyrase inhibitor [Planotetraspora silvatica]|uniref:DNA gyrase inhibitor n=1 Tax=Planotetraspora silvatica TaxID=234614 RepID=A0A8J3UMA3_9ACTN|nr:GyrI-like domain-containing protein [Planotetraspora silvatica]GII47035.1 DNA gyrase inhibitor [Planotetraspora silvatica]
MSQPTLVARAEQPYVAIRRQVTMDTIAEIADRFPEIFGWMAARGLAPAGAPFFRFNVIDMDGILEMEAGVPVTDVVPGDGVILSGVLPAGRYVSVTHVGHPDDLMDVTAELLRWAAERDLRWDMAPTSEGERWGCRLELYKTDPAVEPDMGKWETELAFRLDD